MMTPEDILPEELFAEAIQLPGDQQIAFIEERCGKGTSVALDLIRLLESHQKNGVTGQFILDRPAVVMAGEAVAELAESTGDTIGRYKLLEKIGEGGMGVVYMAEQVEGVRRRVALKIIKLGMDTRQVIARFEAEQQAMALFDHPNITKVLDAGATAAGRPYFVMELVRGTYITDYVKKQRLTVQQRLSLFVDVCGAVQHAHQKGIIHRDIKPSNILVTMHDGVPVPKVIDFGIAKAIGQHRLTDKTLFTRYSAMIGTPQYMSPEQAELNGLDVDTRSDIYSLGVLLYELVTGTTPLSREKLKEINLLDLHETLRDALIETPSMRVQNSAADLDAGPVPIDTAIKATSFGELDWVTMKALSRDRSERYASANELAADVSRYLAHEPVLAVPPSRLRKISAFVRRNRKALILTTAVSILMLLCSVACLVMATQLFRSNRKLESTNAKLLENVRQLEVAESQVRQVVEQKQMSAAISIALAKFEMDFLPRLPELAIRIDPERSIEWYQGDEEVHEEDEQESSSGEDLGVVAFAEEGFAAFCFDFDRSRLLDLEHASLVDDSLRPIRNHMNESKDFMQRIYDMDESELGVAGSGHEHSPECLELQAKANLLVDKYRPVFYRHLVAQYRHSFGDRNPSVAKALNLLAASLIESRKFTQAESHLREAMAIGADESLTVSQTLLRECRKRTKQAMSSSRTKPRK